jgi:hypothetical protein
MTNRKGSHNLSPSPTPSPSLLLVGEQLELGPLIARPGKGPAYLCAPLWRIEEAGNVTLWLFCPRVDEGFEVHSLRIL